MPANSNITMPFGGGRSAPQANNQSVAEALTATTSRKMKGAKRNGGMSIHLFCDASAAVTSATGVTVWYSNMPEPDETIDAHWTQDTSLGTALALTTTGTTFLALTGKQAEWVRIKCDVTAGQASVRAFYRAEGVEV